MGQWAEFEEKEYETLANAAFLLNQAKRGRSPKLFSPGQVLEGRYGYDFATRVTDPATLRRILGWTSPGVPPGVPAGQAGLRNTRATHMLNVFLQYKRPERFMAGRHRSQLWPRDTDFLRFSVQQTRRNPQGQPVEQLQTLIDLETALKGQGAVRYACPSVWSAAGLYGSFQQGNLISRSAFVPPGNLEVNGIKHRYWTFDPRDPSVGIPNPDGPRAKASNGLEFGEHLTKLKVMKWDETPDKGQWMPHLEQVTGKLRRSLGETAQDRLQRAEDHLKNIKERLEEQSPPGKEQILAFFRTGVYAAASNLRWLIHVR